MNDTENLIKLAAQKQWLVFVFFAVVIGVFYGNTLRNGFIYDDVQIVPNNPYIQSLKYLPKVVTGCMWEHTYYDQCKGRALYYRPVHTLSYILTYQISSSPWFFHLVNLAYFFAVVSLLFILGKILTKNFILSFVAAFLFLIHPINSESVNWIAAVPELTFAIFTLLSVIFYIKHRQEKNANIIKFLPAAAFYFLAILAKEPAVFLPAVFLLIDWRMFKFGPEDFLRLRELKKYFLLAGLAAVYVLMRLAVLGSIFPHGKSPYADLSIAERIFSFFFIFAQYLKKLFYPYPLLFFYRFESRSDFLSPQFLISFLAVAAFFALLFYAWKKNKNLPLLALFWIFLFLLPVIIFIGAAGESVISERYLFIPNIGFALAFGWFFAELWRKHEKARILLCGILIFAAAVSWWAVFNRNHAWNNNEVFDAATLAVNPDATPIRFNYAVLLRMEKNDFEKAKEQFEEIIRRNPNWADNSMVYMHLGDYYQQKGEDEKALEYYYKSATASDDWKTHFGYNRIGAFWATKGDYIKALVNFCQALQVNPDSKEVKANFDRAAFLLDERYKKEPGQLYGDVVNGGAFAKSPAEKIKFISQFCDEEYCGYVFMPRVEGYEVVLPLLIAASGEKNEPVELKGSSFNPELNQVLFRVGPKFKGKTLTFVFPTCAGVYYEAVAIP